MTDTTETKQETCSGLSDLTVKLAADKLDAERYRWLRDRLAIEDIERIEREFFGTPEECESAKTDIAIDAAMAANALANAPSVSEGRR